MTRTPLHHIVRVRRSEDLTFMRPGLMDEVLVNANQLENSPESTATALRETTLPYSIDPMLTRFQVPEWWRNDRGETKRNYARLAAAYVKGTSIEMASGPLLETVPSEAEWRRLARNVIDYQQNRLVEIRPQLDLFAPELRPVRLMAPALVAYSDVEDRINRLLAEAAAEAADARVGLPVVVPLERLRDTADFDQLLTSVPTDGVSSYFLWTPGVTEELLISDRSLLSSLIIAVSGLSGRGIAVGHLHATYLTAALHDLGVSAVVNHMGWVDKGEPVGEKRGGLRSCQTYVPGIRHSVTFDRAHALGDSLDATQYAERFCDCTFCTGSFEAGQHPLNLLLEEQLVTFRDGRNRITPTGRATALNTWHFLSARRVEIEAFSDQSAVDVIRHDMERARVLAGTRDHDRLQRLASELRTA